MKKRNAIAAICIAAMMAFGAALAGCSAGPDPAEQVKADLAAQFDPVKNLDQAAVEELVAGLEAANEFETYGIDSAAYVNSMLSGFDYAIGDVAVAEDATSATATVSITCKSFTDAAERAATLSEEFAASGAFLDMSMDEMNKKIGSIMMQAMDETEVKTTECTFEYRLTDDAWVIDGDAQQQIYNAFFA
ncbi:MAG: hypothetical protein Q4B69_05720 [Slackia sp.]|nr:hypothetical protein [Slackia sp.]